MSLGSINDYWQCKIVRKYRTRPLIIQDMFSVLTMSIHGYFETQNSNLHRFMQPLLVKDIDL